MHCVQRCQKEVLDLSYIWYVNIYIYPGKCSNEILFLCGLAFHFLACG